MRSSPLLLFPLVVLIGCGKAAPPPPESDGGGPQIATSIEDSTLAVDRSDQITGIDAATGDSGGMPKDGGAVVRATKPQPRPPVVAPSGVTAPVPAAGGSPSPAPGASQPPPQAPAPVPADDD